LKALPNIFAKLTADVHKNWKNLQNARRRRPFSPAFINGRELRCASFVLEVPQFGAAPAVGSSDSEDGPYCTQLGALGLALGLALGQCLLGEKAYNVATGQLAETDGNAAATATAEFARVSKAGRPNRYYLPFDVDSEQDELFSRLDDTKVLSDGESHCEASDLSDGEASSDSMEAVAAALNEAREGRCEGDGDTTQAAGSGDDASNLMVNLGTKASARGDRLDLSTPWMLGGGAGHRPPMFGGSPRESRPLSGRPVSGRPDSALSVDFHDNYSSRGRPDSAMTMRTLVEEPAMLITTSAPKETADNASGLRTEASNEASCRDTPVLKPLGFPLDEIAAVKPPPTADDTAKAAAREDPHRNPGSPREERKRRQKKRVLTTVRSALLPTQRIGLVHS
jgi:hypothetical protein